MWVVGSHATRLPTTEEGGSERFGDGNSDRGGDKKIEPARTKGRAFQMTADEAEDAPDVVTGTFLINSTLAKVLFDTGANRSFTSPNFIRGLGVKPKCLDYSFDVDVAGDRSVSIGEVFEGCSIFIDGHGFPLRLYPIGMGEFDVILGMDWLASNNADIVCNKKLIRIPLLDKGELVIYGDRRERKF